MLMLFPCILRITPCTLIRILAQTKIQLFEILRSLEAVPGVQIETGAETKAPSALRMPEEDEDMPDADQRVSSEKHILLS